jgi:hypothetical protein
MARADDEERPVICCDGEGGEAGKTKGAREGRKRRVSRENADEHWRRGEQRAEMLEMKGREPKLPGKGAQVDVVAR